MTLTGGLPPGLSPDCRSEEGFLVVEADVFAE
jgi:hypothetical protein